jgi:hypothetical protein
VPAAVVIAGTGARSVLIGRSTRLGGLIGICDVGNPGVRGGARATSPDSRTRHRIILVATPDTEVEGGVVFLVSAGELDSRTGFAVAAANNLDLGAAGVWSEISIKLLNPSWYLRVVELGLSIVGSVNTCLCMSMMYLRMRKGERCAYRCAQGG